MFEAIGGILGGLGQLAGGASSLFGGGNRSGSSTDWAAMNAQMAFQREMAQNSISWRVQDAKNAGISPLVALGAPTFSPSISIPSNSYESADPGAGFRQMGQGAGDLVKALTRKDKDQSVSQIIQAAQQVQSNDLDIQIKGAQLRMLEKQIARPDAPDITAGAGAGQSTVKSPTAFEIKPAEITSQAPGTSTSEAGPPIADTRFMRTPSGVRSFPAAKTLDDTDIFNPEYLEWAWRNKVFPNKARAPTPEYMAKHFPGSIGAKWNQWELEWQPIYPKGGRIK